MKYIISALLLTLSLQANAYDDSFTNDFDKTDIAREAVFLTLMAVDYKQTLDIKNNPNMWEQNPLLGKHPSDKKIKTYFVATSLAHVGIAMILPKEHREVWQYVGIALEALVVIHNKKMGLQFSF
jgi:hypothetical protein